MNIALLTICTGKYQKYIPGFVNSANNNFLKNHNLFIYVFTDSVSEITKKDNVFLIPEPQKPWPYSTLMRFHIFTENYKLFDLMDVIYFVDGDIVFDKEVTDEILPDKDYKLIGVEHPGFWNKNTGSFDRNPHSTAFVHPKQDQTYFQGCFFGGLADSFIKMSFALKKNIDIDLSKNIIALWHDESHMNWYFVNFQMPKALPPKYAYPENCGHEKFGIPKEWIMIHLNKDQEEMRK